MDFFERQKDARRQTRLLIVLFALVVPVVVALTCVLVDLVLIFPKLMTIVSLSQLSFWHPQLFASIALVMCASISLGCSYKIRKLARGGAVVAELLGGRKVASHPQDPDEQRLRHVVEEMAIASGMPMPAIYVLDRERGLNTFAAGHTLDDVAIGVTYAALKLLTRDELQGAIAHEFSHVLNGDTRLNMRLMGLAHGLLWPTIACRVLLNGSAQRLVSMETILENQVDDPWRAIFLPVAVPLQLMGCVGTPFVRLMKSAICRKREWQADAAAVQFTRNPAGIEGALKKIGGLLKQGRLDTPYAEVASHLYLTNSSFAWYWFFSTHPPLQERVRAIDPAFDGHFEHIHSLPSKDAEYDQIYEASVKRAKQNPWPHTERE